MIIAVLNQKGGTAKTTTAAAVTSGLHILKGRKTLAIDLDAQQNLSICFGQLANDITITEVLKGDAEAAAAIVKTEQGDIIPASTELSTLDGLDELGDKILSTYSLKNVIEPLKDKYDYIVLDCPPALSTFTLNALVAADKVIITAGADLFSIQGIKELSKTIAAVKIKRNPTLEVMGVLLTRYNPKTKVSKDMLQILDKLAKQLNSKVFNSTIRESTTIKESQLMSQSLFTYAPDANVTKDYAALIDEIIEE